MKAVVYERYGSPDVLRMAEVERPSLRDDQLLVRVKAASVTPFDWHLLLGEPLLARLMAGLFKPRNHVLGTDVAGVVERIGAAVTRFQPGDEVLGGRSSGGYAELASVPESELQLKPPHLTFTEAAALPFSAHSALFCLYELGALEAGQQLLLNGASGGVGTVSLQIAKGLGAEITAVCSNGSKNLVSSLGADHIVDYATEDFVKRGERYDLIFDIAAKRSFSDCSDALKPAGIYITTEFSPVLALRELWISRRGSRKMIALSPMGPGEETRRRFGELVAAGEVNPLVDSTYSLAETADAFRHFQGGHIRGRITIAV